MLRMMWILPYQTPHKFIWYQYYFGNWSQEGGLIGLLTNIWLFGLKVAASDDRPSRPFYVCKHENSVFQPLLYSIMTFLLFLFFWVLIFLILYGITTFKNEYIFSHLPIYLLVQKYMQLYPFVWLKQTMIYFYAGLRIRVRKLDIRIVQIVTWCLVTYSLWINHHK